MNTTKHVGLACALGSGTGAFLAVQFNPLWWWLGVLIGGAVGYLSYEADLVLKAIRTVWSMIDEVSLKDTLAKMKELSEVASVMLKLIGGSLFIGLPWCMLIIAIIYRWQYGSVITPTFAWLHSHHVADDSFLISSISLVTGMASIVFFAVLGNIKDGLDPDIVEMLPIAVRKTNVATVLAWYLPQGIWFLVKQIPMFIRVSGKLTKGTFVLIHSDMRLLCMTDSLIGGLVGYHYHSVLVGMLCGAALGVLNYKVITTWALKLKPATT